MKTTIAIIGAGPGLGLASARRFGAEGFNVALLSRTQEHVDALAAELADAGITARGYAADVSDEESLNTALDRAADELGVVEILHYSPVHPRNICGPFLKRRAKNCALRSNSPLWAPPPSMRYFRACVPLAAELSSSSTAPARFGPTTITPAPPLRSPPNPRTPRCSTTPWHRKESTSHSSSFPWASVEATQPTSPRPWLNPLAHLQRTPGLPNLRDTSRLSVH